MDWHLVQFSVVVLGESHNPTILNPDFLERECIVPEGWSAEVDRSKSVTTPPLAVVRYRNGVSITVEQNRLQVVDVGDINGPGESKTPQIARGYVETLQHVPYTALGFNFRSVAELPDVEAYLKEQFVNLERCNTGQHKVTTVGLRLNYELVDCRLVLSLDTGTAQLRDQEKAGDRKVVISNGNFHRDCAGASPHEQVLQYLGKVTEDWSRYKALLNDLFNPETR